MAGRPSRFDAAKRYFELSSEERDRIAEEVELSAEFEELADSTIKRREETKEELEAFWASQDHTDDLWEQPVEVLANTIKTWLTAKVEGTKPHRKRINATHVTYSTLKSWRMSVTRVVCKYVKNGQKMLNDSLYVTLCKHVGFVTVKYKLELLAGRKQFCGRQEVRLITEAIYADCVDLEWSLQTDVALKIMFMTGLRSGSLGPACQRYLDEGRFLKWKDVMALVNSFAEFYLDLSVTALKGYNLIAAKRLELNLRPAKRPDNVIFEVAPPLLLLALKRGAIKGIKDPEQLFEAKGTKIVWEDWAMEQPIFLRGQVGGHPGCETGIVMRSPGITDMLQTAARRIGLDIEAYDFRRNFGDEIEENYGEAGAKTGMGHTPNSNTYKTRYGREAANLDVAGAVMHENLVNRYELNQFRAPALQPHVGLSNATIEGLLNMQERGTSFRVNAQPVQLKRKAPALVQPYAAAPAPYVDQAITDEQCHAHPYWLQFVQDSQYTQRASQMAKHEAVYKDALLEIPALPGKNPHRTIEAKLREAYPDNREYLGAYLEWVRIRDIQHAAETRKIHTIREAISATRATDTKRSSTEETSTFAARQDRIAQFQAPSMLVDIAMLHVAPPRPRTRVAASETVAIDSLLDPTFREFNEDDPREVDVDEVPTWLIRAGYMRMLWTCGKDVHPTCPDCEIDPTVEDGDREKIWTPFKLQRHRNQFHTVEMQLVRWYNKHKSCLLCALDNITVKYPRSTYTRHINRTNGFHVGDPRLPSNPVATEIVIARPLSFLSSEEVIDQEESWARAFDGVKLPESFIGEAAMVGVLAGAMMLGVDEGALRPHMEVDVAAVTKAYKRIKISREQFVFVGAPGEDN